MRERREPVCTGTTPVSFSTFLSGVREIDRLLSLLLCALCAPRQDANVSKEGKEAATRRKPNVPTLSLTPGSGGEK